MKTLFSELASIASRLAAAIGILGACASLALAQQVPSAASQVGTSQTLTGSFTTCPVQQSGAVGQGATAIYNVSVPSVSCSYSFTGSLHYKVVGADQSSGNGGACWLGSDDPLPGAEAKLHALVQTIEANAQLSDNEMAALSNIGIFLPPLLASYPVWVRGATLANVLSGSAGFIYPDNHNGPEGDLVPGQSATLHFRCASREQMENVWKQASDVFDWAVDVMHGRGINLRAFLQDHYHQ